MRVELKRGTLNDLFTLKELVSMNYIDTCDKDITQAYITEYIDKTFTIPKLSKELTREDSLFYLMYVDKKLVGYTKLNKYEAQLDIKSPKSLEIEKIYQDIGYKVIKTNAQTGENVQSIKDVLKNNITAFSGNSGVGKSTLINGIFKDKIAEEGTISNKNKKGKNTTTTVELYKIDNNSYIADTPGFATFDIYEIKSGELDEYFREFHNYIEECEYIGCNHIKEINCGVKKAVEYEKISKMRYQNYCKIYNELKQKEDNRW